MARASWWAAIGAMTAVIAACGPNLRTMADGQVEWERCYALDRDPGTSNDDRGACWTSWQGSYGNAAGADRAQYANTRLAEIRRPPGAPSSGGAPQDPRPMGAPNANAQVAANANVGVSGTANGAPNNPNVTFGTPTANGVPIAGGGQPGGDPNVGAQQPSDGNGTAPGGGANSLPPGQTCAGSCRGSWSSCNTPCRSQAACVAQCDNTYRDCMRGCY